MFTRKTPSCGQNKPSDNEKKMLLTGRNLERDHSELYSIAVQSMTLFVTQLIWADIINGSRKCHTSTWWWRSTVLSVREGRGRPTASGERGGWVGCMGGVSNQRLPLNQFFWSLTSPHNSLPLNGLLLAPPLRQPAKACKAVSTWAIYKGIDGQLESRDQHETNIL